jgi:hypothetical protein
MAWNINDMLSEWLVQCYQDFLAKLYDVKLMISRSDMKRTWRNAHNQVITIIMSEWALWEQHKIFIDNDR